MNPKRNLGFVQVQALSAKVAQSLAERSSPPVPRSPPLRRESGAPTRSRRRGTGLFLATGGREAGIRSQPKGTTLH